MESRAATRDELNPRRPILAGDIGGTKTVLAVYPRCVEALQPSVEQTYASQDHNDLESIIESFLERVDGPIGRACLAVAGPVDGGRVRMTNLPWEIDAQRISTRFGFEHLELMNDLEAIARSIPFLSPLDLFTLHPAKHDPHAPIAVIAPGTGLGEAYLTWDGATYQSHASEGGHADFAPTGELQSDLLTFLRKELGHVSIERVASGAGIPNIYRFLRGRCFAKESPALAELLERTDDPTPPIVSAAVNSRDALCEETLRLFVSILGAEAGNLALKLLATGGIYLGGGLPPRILPFLQSDRFLAAIHGKGRFEPLLKRIPVHVILNHRAALLGAAQRALEALTA